MFAGKLQRVSAAIALGLTIFAASRVQAQEVPTRIFDGAAREIATNLRAGNGWCAVSSRAPVQLLSISQPVDCLRYRIVTSYRIGTTSNDQFYIDLTYSEETPWIAVELKTPTASGPSLTAAKAANEAIGMIDNILPELEASLAAEGDEGLKDLGRQVVSGLLGQRSALVDLISKDIQTVEMAQ